MSLSGLAMMMIGMVLTSLAKHWDVVALAESEAIMLFPASEMLQSDGNGQLEH